MISLRKAVSSLRKHLRNGWKATVKFASMKVLYPAVYRIHSLRPVDERRVVFVEVRMQSVSDNYALYYDTLKCGYDFDLHVHFLEELLVPMVVTYRRSIQALRDIARAKYVFINDATNMINAVHVRPETKVIQTWHACGPFKMFGYSVADLKFGATRRQMELYPIHRNYTHLILGGEASVAPYAEAMGMEDKPENIYPIGVSRTDVFYDPAFLDAAREKLYRLMPQARDKKVILYAPTFRGRVATASTPNVLRPEMLMEALGDRYVLVENHHPFVKKRPKIPAACRDFCQDMTGRMSIEELLCVSDICVTDYSSLVFEYSLFRRPMLFFAYDLDDYYDWRGFYYKYEDFVCGPIVTTNRELIREIENIDSYDLSRVEAFRERFMTRCDGHATQRVLDTVFGPEVLAAHRRATPLQGAFHTVPHAPSRRDGALTMRLRRRFFSASLPRLYRRAAARPAGDTAVLLQYRGSAEREDFVRLRQALETAMPRLNVKTIQLTRDVGGGLSYLQACRDAVREIAAARVLITAEDNPVTAALPLRPETVHVRLPDPVWPIEPFGRAALPFMGGYDLPFDYPDYRNVTLAPAPASCRQADFAAATGTSAPALGAPVLDLLRDPAWSADARRRLEAAFPAAAGRRVLLYAPAARMKNRRGTAPARPDLQLLLEYLSPDWVVAAHYPPRCGGRKKPGIYFDNFYRDLSDALPLEVLMAAADVCVTDIRPEAMAFAATGRPLLPFAPDYAALLPGLSPFPGWDRLFAAPFTGETRSLLAVLQDLPRGSTGYFDCADGARRTAEAVRDILAKAGDGR